MDTATLSLTTSGNTVAGGNVSDDGSFTTDYTSTITGTGESTWSYVVIDTQHFSAFEIAQLENGNAKVLVNFTVHTSSTVTATVKAFASDEDFANPSTYNPVASQQLADPTPEYAADLSNLFDENDASPLATISVRQGVSPFTSDTNENAVQTIDVTSQVLASINFNSNFGIPDNLIVYFDGAGAALGVSTNVTNVTASIQSTIDLPYAYTNNLVRYVGQAAEAPFAGAVLASTVPSSLTSSNPSSGTITIGSSDGTRPSSTVFTDNSTASQPTAELDIVQSAATGLLSGTGLTTSVGTDGTITYKLMGTAASLTAALQNLVFTPTAGTSAQTAATTFTVTEVAIPGRIFVPQQVATLGTLAFSTGRVSGATFTNGTTQVVTSGGVAVGTVLSGTVYFSDSVHLVEGFQVVSAGGVASGTIVNAGTVTVSAGGLTVATVLQKNDFGIVNDVTTPSQEYVLNDGVASGTVVSSGGTQFVSSGGSATGTVVSSGGSQIVSSGATASGTQISSGGQEIILGSASLSVVQGGGTQVVSSGGLVTRANILSGGLQTVAGTASGTTVQSGGSQSVSSGGVALATNISAGGTETVSAGGLASRSYVSSGGVLQVQSGATASATMVQSSGQEVVSGGGVSVAAVIGVGGLEYVFGQTSAAQVTSGSQVVQSGGVTQGSVLSGGTQTVSAGGNASGTVVRAGGVQMVTGGLASGTVVSSGGAEVLQSHGGAISTVLSGGVLSAGSGTNTNGTMVSSGGVEILVNATALGTTVFQGGRQVIGSSGDALATSVSSGGVVVTSMGGYIGSSTIGAGGSAVVMSGGKIAYSVISGGLIDVQSGGSTTGIVFAGTGGTLETEGTGFGAGASISGFVIGDRINFANVAYDAGGSVSLGSKNVLSFVENGYTYTFQLDPMQSFAGMYFHLVSDQGTDVVVDTTPCYCTGTRIATPLGEIEVERLAIGDLVVTAGGAHRPVRWIGHRRYAGRFANTNPAALPVCFTAGSLGGGLPVRDLWVSPKHAMFLDEVLVPAECLVNGRSVFRAVSVAEVEYWHVELGSHDVLLAEGAPSESFLDDDSRGMFHNAAEYAALYPDAPAPSGFCAPRVESGRQLEAIRQRLVAIADEVIQAA